MAGLKEIASRLKSVKNTKKITSAMKLVSAAKLRRAQEAVSRTREYTKALQTLVVGIARESAQSIAHPLLQAHEQVRRIRFIVIGGSRGLCGGYNSNLQKLVESYSREILKSHPNATIDYVLVGRKPAEYFRRINRPTVATYETLPEDPNLWPIEEIASLGEDAFLRGEIDEAYLIFTRFRSAISVKPVAERFLPLDTESVTAPGQTAASGPVASGTTISEPSANELFAELLPRVLRGRVRQAGLEAKASEFGSRMTAMDNATKNANELCDQLRLTANKLRQTNITSQLLDIVGGAEALK